ncbi:uncharacterized protein LOC114713706 [Neltuma alba]|uniref:uncharacterized protein LOC114713706 n=1 Tax=Neltuma alba TaxID=207710 RepID=UPI0010A4F465|nr:uncharacterized protein LOC114713706 [Prosopis alba]
MQIYWGMRAEGLMSSSLVVVGVEEETKLVRKQGTVTILKTIRGTELLLFLPSRRRFLSVDIIFSKKWLSQKKTASSQKLSHSETIVASAHGKYGNWTKTNGNSCGRTRTSIVPGGMQDEISTASLIKHDAEMADKPEAEIDRSESILSLRKSTVWGNRSHLRARLASFMEATMAAKLVVVGGALVSLMAVLLRGTINKASISSLLGNKETQH